MEFRRTKAFTKALDKLGAPGQARVNEKLKTFEQDVLGGVSLQHLWDVYEFKPLKGANAEVSSGLLRGQVQQIRPLHDYRVLMLALTVGDKTHYLHAWRKQGNSDPEEIRHGCNLAKSLIEKLAQEATQRGGRAK